ncbi:MAG: DMT family transporter [Chromatiales bacterium]|jgi:drug/metabolite transporter (DMT)-like permease|nr:DMT family transporter [Chromatiales bacterium]
MVEPRRQTGIGVAAGIGAGLCLSSGGIALRLVESADGWQILTVRGAALAATIFLWLGFHYRTRALWAVVALGARGATAAFAIGITAILYVFAILNTTVANTVVILSLSPLITATLAWLMLGEKVATTTLGSIAVAILGVAIMFMDSLGGGGSLGMLIALGAAICFAIFVVTLRAGRDIDMVPAIGLSGLVTLAVAAVMAPDLDISRNDLGIGVFLGVFQLALGYACVAIATRHLPATLAALLILSEVVFAPLWAWVGVGEMPTAWAAVGAATVVGAVAYQAGRAN